MYYRSCYLLAMNELAQASLFVLSEFSGIRNRRKQSSLLYQYGDTNASNLQKRSFSNDQSPFQLAIGEEKRTANNRVESPRLFKNCRKKV